MDGAGWAAACRLSVTAGRPVLRSVVAMEAALARDADSGLCNVITYLCPAPRTADGIAGGARAPPLRRRGGRVGGALAPFVWRPKPTLVIYWEQRFVPLVAWQPGRQPPPRIATCRQLRRNRRCASSAACPRAPNSSPEGGVLFRTWGPRPSAGRTGDRRGTGDRTAARRRRLSYRPGQGRRPRDTLSLPSGA